MNEEMQAGDRIRLTQKEYKLVSRVARQRYENSRGANRRDGINADVPLKPDYSGTGGEFAVSKITKAPFNINTKGPDRGWDILLDNGEKLDVKSTDNPRGNFVVNIEKLKAAKCDYFVGMRGPFEEMECIGWITREQIMERGEKKPAKNDSGPYWFVPAEKMNKTAFGVKRVV
jgi:hypothetical protein